MALLRAEGHETSSDTYLERTQEAQYMHMGRYNEHVTRDVACSSLLIECQPINTIILTHMVLRDSIILLAIHMQYKSHLVKREKYKLLLTKF